MAPLDLVTPSARPTEGLGLHIINKGAWVPDGLQARLAAYTPKSSLGALVKDLLGHWYLPAEMANELLDKLADVIVLESRLAVAVLRGAHSPLRMGDVLREDHGVVSRRVITTTGVEMLVDVFQSSGNGLSFKWHAIGLSSAAEAVGNTALTNEMTTAGYGSATRGQGTQTTGSAGAHVYETVATITIDSVTSGTPMVIQEHGIFKTSGVGSTGLWDRSLTGTQTLSTGDSIQVTYDLTINSGG